VISAARRDRQRYSLTGVGAATSARGDVYLTQIFVAPR